MPKIWGGKKGKWCSLKLKQQLVKSSGNSGLIAQFQLILPAICHLLYSIGMSQTAAVPHHTSTHHLMCCIAGWIKHMHLSNHICAPLFSVCASLSHLHYRFNSTSIFKDKQRQHSTAYTHRPTVRSSAVFFLSDRWQKWNNICRHCFKLMPRKLSSDWDAAATASASAKTFCPTSLLWDFTAGTSAGELVLFPQHTVLHTHTNGPLIRGKLERHQLNEHVKVSHINTQPLSDASRDVSALKWPVVCCWWPWLWPTPLIRSCCSHLEPRWPLNWQESSSSRLARKWSRKKGTEREIDENDYRSIRVSVVPGKWLQRCVCVRFFLHFRKRQTL